MPAYSSQSSLYYISFTCRYWLPLFEIVNGYELVYKWFDFLKSNKAIKTTGFIIMPNHVHCKLFFPTEQYDLSKIVANGKRFIAYEIIKRLKEKGLNNKVSQSSVTRQLPLSR